MRTTQSLSKRVIAIVATSAIAMSFFSDLAFAGFWRTIDGTTADGVPSPESFLFGVGTDGVNT